MNDHNTPTNQAGTTTVRTAPSPPTWVAGANGGRHHSAHVHSAALQRERGTSERAQRGVHRQPCACGGVALHSAAPQKRR